jgi:hypothetical protein
MATTPFTQIHTSKKYRVLTRKMDSAGNAYVYLKGVASLAAGDFVVFDKDGATTRTVAASTGPVAMAMAANTSSSNYSWFLVRGYNASANIATHSNGAGKALFTTATAGRLSSTPTTEATCVGAFTTANAVSNVGGVLMSDPVAPGDIST